MEKEKIKDIKIGLNKMQAELRNKARISECFHFDTESCKGKIKSAHSIQRNGRLSLLEEEVQGNMKIYSFTEVQPNENTGKLELKPIGKASASTFFGFCDYHDNKLFSVIEDNPFIDCSEHCFLHSYRAFAITHHRKTEQIKAFESDSKFNDIMGSTTSSSLAGTRIGYQDGEKIRIQMNEILKNETYDEMESLTIQFPDFYPIASSSSFTPKYTPKTNKKLNYDTNPDVPYEYLFLNVLPDLNGSKVIFSCLPGSEKSIQYIDEFDSLPDLKQNQILTSILIGYIENTFISPYIYNKLTEKEKECLIRELSDTTIFSTKFQTKHFLSKLNFFQNRFIKSA